MARASQPGPIDAGAPRIGAFATVAQPVPADTLCPDIEQLFAGNPHWGSVVVVHPDHGLCVLDRQAFEARMTGPYGFGHALHGRSPVGSFVDPRGTLRLPAGASILTAYQALVGRPPR